MSVTVVIGGTRSGKSARAEALARATGLPVRYVATADATDPAMAARIRVHVERRPPEWTTVSAGGSLIDAVGGGPGACVLLDGLGPWIATALHEGGAFATTADPDALDALCDRLLEDIDAVVVKLRGAAAAIVVCEQAGEGVLPADAASRRWLDVLGAATQKLTANADRVELVVAGRALALGPPTSAEPPVAAATVAPVAPESQEPAAGTAGISQHDLRRHGDTLVRPGDADHAVNVVAGGPPPWLRDALRHALDSSSDSYPSEAAACAALAARHGRLASEIVPTNGAAEALWLLGPALHPRLAACVHPGFTEAEAGLRAHGIPVVRVQRDPDAGFALNPLAVPEAADLVVVGNPASPSGTLDPASALLALRRPGRTVVVDEAFMDLVPGEPGALVSEPLDDVIVIRSLTKALSVPGLRVGYAVAPPALADALRAVRPLWSANALALATLIAATEHPAELAAIAERAADERADLQQRLRAVPGIRVWPGAANFCLIEVDDGPRVVAALREKAIAVRPAASFPGLEAGHLRVTARGAAENARLADALAAAVSAVA